MNGISKTCGVFRSALSRHLAITQTTTRRHLPICTVDTSRPREEIPANFASELSSLVASQLNKPAELVSVVIRSDLDVIRGKSLDHSVFCQIWSVGVFDEERNPGYSVEFINFLMSKLDMPFEKVALLFNPIERSQAGHLLYADVKNK